MGLIHPPFGYSGVWEWAEDMAEWESRGCTYGSLASEAQVSGSKNMPTRRLQAFGSSTPLRVDSVGETC